MIKKRSVSSRRWLQEHFRDKYVQEAQKRGLRSRAWFKLAEIEKRDQLFQSGMTVVDLGASPGGWSQYVITRIREEGRVIACDILPMEPIVGVSFLQGDLRDPKILQALLERLGKEKVQVVLSDMVPNMSGMRAIDLSNTIYLVQLALEVCQKILVPHGSFLVKVFQGEGFDEYLREIRSLFGKVKIRKPEASRARSSEVYIVATEHKFIAPYTNN